jgi:hypothetical protein
MGTNWNVKTQAAAYVDGYQNGMRDIAQVLATRGLAGIEEWLKNNRNAETHPDNPDFN